MSARYISVKTVLSWSITDKLPRPLWYQENLPRAYLHEWTIIMQIYPCLKIDHCNRRVDCRIFRILIKHDIQATKSMFGLSQSNLCCVVVFIPRLCMMAELLCVVCPLRTAEVRGPLPVSRSRSATSCVTVSTSQLSSIPTSNNGREDFWSQ